MKLANERNNMGNPLRQYIYEIGSALGKLGNALCQQAQNPHKPLNFHGNITATLDNMLFSLHQLSADLDTWRKEILAKNGKIELPNVFHSTDGIDVESAYCAVHHLLHSPAYDVDSGEDLTFTEELRKLEWLFEELQNIHDTLKESKASYEDFNFNKITGNR